MSGDLDNRNNLLRPGREFQREDMTGFKKALIAAAMSAAMAGSQASAADASLAPGKPAGVKEAQRGSPSLWLIGGAAVVAVVAVVVATQSSNDATCGSACTAPTTTS
jgi:hypothetical protein